MNWPTVRKYPRTLREAFPRDAQHAYAVERHERFGMTLGDFVLAALIAAALAAVLLHSMGALFV